MYRILVFADSHDRIAGCMMAVGREKPVDRIFHAGDMEADANALRKEFPDIPVDSVTGNNDYAASPEYEKIITVGETKIFLTHGHRYRVKQTLDPLIRAAIARDADIVVFGHTHRPFLKKTDGIWYLNPGEPRARGGNPGTYGVIEFGESDFTIRLGKI